MNPNSQPVNGPPPTDGGNTPPRPIDGVSTPGPVPGYAPNGQPYAQQPLPPPPPPPPGTPISPPAPDPYATPQPVQAPQPVQQQPYQPAPPQPQQVQQPSVSAAGQPPAEALRPMPPPPSPEEIANLKAASRPTLFSKIQKGLKSIVTVLSLALVVLGGAALLNAFVFQSYYVDGHSMEPALHNNDRLIISKVERTGAKVAGKPYVPKRGQIVVLDESSSQFTLNQSEQLIKRVIGLPGDKIKIANGKVTITNKNDPKGFNPDETLGLNVAPTFSEAPMEVVVPENQIFVMGDNRAEGGSYDSRAFGPITTNHVLGRLWVRILPLNQMHVF